MESFLFVYPNDGVSGQGYPDGVSQDSFKGRRAEMAEPLALRQKFEQALKVFKIFVYITYNY